MNKIILLMMFSMLCAVSYAADTNPMPEQTLHVQFQLKSAHSNSWSTSSATLKGAATESMIRNQLMSRWPNHQIRVLAVDTGDRKLYSVRYQVSRDGKNWTGGSTVLQNSITQSMARNQISQRYPGMKVRILSMTRL